jgi:hypothetical protein
MTASYTVDKIYNVRLPKQFVMDCADIVTHILKEIADKLQHYELSGLR